MVIRLLELPSLLLIKGVDVRLGEFPSRHLLREEHVELLKGAIFGLGKPEESPSKEDESCSTPEEGYGRMHVSIANEKVEHEEMATLTGSGAHIPGSRVHEVGL